MAVEAEYGPHLKRLFVPLMTGVGPVEAGVALASALAGLKASGELPDLVVSLGSAGSRTLEQTEVYQAASVTYRDMDASRSASSAAHALPRPARDRAAAAEDSGGQEATLSTGAAIISGAAYDRIAEDMVDMETFACLRACQRFPCP